MTATYHPRRFSVASGSDFDHAMSRQDFPIAATHAEVRLTLAYAVLREGLDLVEKYDGLDSVYAPALTERGRAMIDAAFKIFTAGALMVDQQSDGITVDSIRFGYTRTTS